MGEASGKSYMTGPRWFGVESILRKTALRHDVELIITAKEGLIFQTVFYTVSGPYHKVCGFREELMMKYS